MATYHLRVKTVSRGKGQSAIAAAAYRSGERLIDAKTGEIKHYRQRADRILFAGIFAPPGAPVWAQDRNLLWNEAERIERRKDAMLAREIELSLPHELTHTQRLWLVQDFVRENFTRRGLIVDVAIHRPDKGGDPRNFHAHLLIVERKLGPRGFAVTKDRSLASKATLFGWRANWAKLVNRYLTRFGHAARIDHRSLKAQGIKREPTKPVGSVATQMQRRGIKTPRGDRRHAIHARNALWQGLRGAAREVIGHLPPPPGGTPATGHGSAVQGIGFRSAATDLTAQPMSSSAPARGAATAIEQAAPESAREVCGRMLLAMTALAAVSALDAIGGADAEPCSYDAEVAWIVGQHAMRIDGIRRGGLPPEQAQAAIRAVMEEQRTALAGVQARRQWRKVRKQNQFVIK